MKKLQKYLLLTSSALTSGILHAGIVYTDVNPDVLLDTDGDLYNIDLDTSGTTDFSVIFSEKGGWGGQNSAYIYGENGNEVGAYIGYSNYQYYLNVYNNYDLISSQLDWKNEGIFGSFYFGGGGGYGGNSNGAWSSQTNKYVALKFYKGTDTFYGWARFDVSNRYEEITIKDYAYDDTPNTSIVAGDKTNTNLIAINIVSKDIDNKHNGNDLEVSFNKANDEDGILEYRMIAVKSSNVLNFNISKANSSVSYVQLSPNGNNQTSIFNSSSKDSDGDLIKENVAYSIFILSVPDLVNITTSNLSKPSNSVTLQSGVSINEPLFNKVSINITNKILSISSENTLDKISISNIKGSLISSKINSTNSIINLNDKESGIYLLTIESNNKIETKKIILQ